MRKWLIKYFVGDRWTKIPFTNIWVNAYKGGRPLILSLISIGIITIIGAPETLGLVLSLLWLCFALYFTFPLGGYGYFQKFPVQWFEMDDLQKWKYGLYVLSGESTIKLELTPEQFEEWVELNNKFKTKFNLK